MDSANWVSIGIDYLQINLKEVVPFLSVILRRLDTNNSNIHFQSIGTYEISVTKSLTKRWPCLNIAVSIENIPYTIFQYLEYSDLQQKVIKSKGKFVYYGTYFRLLEIGKLSYQFEEWFFWDDYPWFSKWWISRLDYKVDLFYNHDKQIPNVKELIKTRSDGKKRYHIMLEHEYRNHIEILKDTARPSKNELVKYNIQSEFIEGMRTISWDYWSKSNKSLYFRMYEKLIESLAKWKAMLYDDYFKYVNVYRFEIEFRIKFNKKLLPSGKIVSYTHSELHELEEKIHKYLWLTTNDTNEKFLYQYEKNKTTDFTEKSKYQKDFGWRGYVLALQGFNPYITLYKVLKKKKLDKKLFNKLVFEREDFIIEKYPINKHGSE